MESSIQIFSNPQFGEIRTAGTAEDPLFCLLDVCNALGIKNARDKKSRLNEKGVVLTDTLTEGGVQQLLFIDEPNLYRCVFMSRKKNAQAFQDWVTEDVLPAIRKTGKYEQKALTPEEMFLQSAQIMFEQRKRMDALEHRMDAFEAEREHNGRILLEATISVNAVPEQTMRDKVRELVNEYAGATNTEYRKVWEFLYKKLFYLHHVQLSKKGGLSKLE